MTAAHPYRLVVALDLNQYASIVLEHALDQAVRHSEPDLHFLTVVDDAARIAEVKSQLAGAVLPVLDTIDRTKWSVRLHVRTGVIAEEIANLAGEIEAQLIVIGRFGTHHPHRHLAKTAGDILDLAPCPVLVAGITETTHVQTSPQCPDCARTRLETHGERWFCERHSDGQAGISTIVPFGSNFTGGTLMW
ncbi:hypothetical protein BH11MYX1_BH11MYX1_56600 [soil metagenome]